MTESVSTRASARFDEHFVRRSPWLWPIADAASCLSGCADWPSVETLDAKLSERTRVAGLPPLRFALDRKRRKRGLRKVALGELYDGRIALHAEVPTREGSWHDLLNALCFATFPASKRALHARQAHAMAPRLPERAARLPSARTSEQDALTLFDEGGAVIASARGAADLLASLPQSELAAAVSALEVAGAIAVIPFGHALFEHMVEGVPCPGASARVLELETIPSGREELLGVVDAELAARLQDPRCFARPTEALHLRLEQLSPRRRNGDARGKRPHER